MYHKVPNSKLNLKKKNLLKFEAYRGLLGLGREIGILAEWSINVVQINVGNILVNFIRGCIALPCLING